MKETRMFPVLSYLRDPRLPAEVPWAFLAPHEAQAIINHGQSLERLAQRGLSEDEMVAVVEGKRWHELDSGTDYATRLLGLLTAWGGAGRVGPPRSRP